jgi:hypothetical protein
LVSYFQVGEEKNIMNEKLGFDIMQKLMEAQTVKELDEAIRIVNHSYRILRERLEVIQKNNIGGVF